jgi:hypothetical protein
VNHAKRDFRHVDLSPPPGICPHPNGSPEALSWLYDEAVKVARVLGIKAALSIAHPYRLNPAFRDWVEARAIQAGKNRYEWALSQDNWRDLVIYSPHFHLLVSGPLMDSRQFLARTGWQYHNHDGKTGGRRGQDLRKTLYYLLTHAWVNGNHKVLRYWFGMSTHRLMRVEEGFAKVPQVCPTCAAACVQVPPDAIQADGRGVPFYQDIHNAPPALTRVQIFHYEARPPGKGKTWSRIPLGVPA